MPYGLSKDIVDRIINVLSKFSEVEEVVLYGSRAKGNFRPGSDIDLTVKWKQLTGCLSAWKIVSMFAGLNPFSCIIQPAFAIHDFIENNIFDVVYKS